MKLTTSEIIKIIPVSAHTVIRFQKESSGFPPPERIGRVNYFDKSAFFQWLNGRATRDGEPVPAGTIRHDDVIYSTSGTGAMVGRSGAWMWENVTKNPNLTQVNLSPKGDSKNPRRYFVKREIEAAFPELSDSESFNQGSQFNSLEMKIKLFFRQEL